MAVITSAIAGSAALATVGVSGAAATAVGAVGAAAVYGGLAYGLSGLMSGGKDGAQQAQISSFDSQAAANAARATANETTKRQRIAQAKNETKLSDTTEAKLGTTGLLGN